MWFQTTKKYLLSPCFNPNLLPPSICLLRAEVFLFPLAQLQITICVASSVPLCEEDQPVQQQQPTAVVLVALLHKGAKKPLFP
jgi:hypothetical protein